MSDVLKAYAKVNLGLHVKRKIKNGYHLLDTVIDLIDLHDDLTIQDLDENKIIVTCFPDVCEEKENICYQVADFLKKQYNIQKGIKITIKKKIPVASGLGGESADAAALLAELNKRWRLHLTKRRLLKIGFHIGSDVPFFLGKRCSRVLGIGRKVKPLKKMKPYPVILFIPRFTLQTKTVFARFNEYRENRMQEFLKGIKKDRLLVFNDLEACVNKMTDFSLQKIKNRLQKLGLSLIVMSGSGPCVCAFLDRALGFAEKNKIIAQNPDLQVIFTETMGSGKFRFKSFEN